MGCLRLLLLDIGDVPRAGLCDWNWPLRDVAIDAGDMRFRNCWTGGGVEGVDGHRGGGKGGTSLKLDGEGENWALPDPNCCECGLFDRELPAPESSAGLFLGRCNDDCGISLSILVLRINLDAAEFWGIPCPASYDFRSFFIFSSAAALYAGFREAEGMLPLFWFISSTIFAYQRRTIIYMNLGSRCRSRELQAIHSNCDKLVQIFNVGINNTHIWRIGTSLCRKVAFVNSSILFFAFHQLCKHLLYSLLHSVFKALFMWNQSAVLLNLILFILH